MKISLRLVKALLIAAVPGASVRRVLLNSLMGYEIAKGANVGFMTVVCVSSFSCGKGTKIGILNVFKGPFDITIGNNCYIGRGNNFLCSEHIKDEKFRAMNYARKLDIGDRCLIKDSHFFDVYGSIRLGAGSWVAGIRSEFWTHGLSVMNRDISIGEENYIGSSTKFAPGACIGSRNIVALGAVVAGNLGCDKSLIGGLPARVIRKIETDVSAGKYRFSFDDWE